MAHKKYTPATVVKNVVAVVLLFWMVMGAFPTGWIYDLGRGPGREQGDRPDSSVQRVRTQEEVEDFFFQDTPATVPKKGLLQCPLMRLRDPGYAGEHTNARKRTVVISEYRFLSNPVSVVDKLVNLFFASGKYNGYYLAPLEDDTYVCVYFDDYLLLKSGEELPAGYVRYSDTEERKMLHAMKEAYGVDPAYVLDMYRPGKVNWMMDTGLRLLAFVLLVSIYQTLSKRVRKRRKSRDEKG